MLLTETKPVPRSWFPPFEDLDLLDLAFDSGQQRPVFGGFIATRSYLALFITDAVISLVTTLVVLFVIAEIRPEV